MGHQDKLNKYCNLDDQDDCLDFDRDSIGKRDRTSRCPSMPTFLAEYRHKKLRATVHNLKLVGKVWGCIDQTAFFVVFAIVNESGLVFARALRNA
jgi:hypothetical protein